MARRWIDPDILGKMGGGLALLALSAAIYFAGRLWLWGWVAGGLLFVWGLFSIGDKKSDWE